MGSVPINMSDAVSRRMLITRPTNSGGVVNWIVALATEKKEALPIPTNSIAGGVTTIKVQHDSASDFSSVAALISFTAVGASTKTSEMVVCSGTVNRYIRATASTAGSSGSITFMVSFARF